MVKVVHSNHRAFKFSFMTNFLVITSLLFSISFQANAALKITASVNQNPVVQGNSFILELRANESISASDWDSSALLADFVVGRTSTNSQTSYMNGKKSHLTTLSTVLMARNIGRYTIPAFTIEGAKTQPIKVSVISPSTASSRGLDNRNIELKVDVTEQDIYVGQQFIYTTTLYIAQNTEMQTGNLTEPTTEDGTIKQIGKDENASQVINGRRFQTITRQYAITINSAGLTTILPSRFEGQVSTAKRGYRFGPSTPVIIQAKKLNLNIKPQPIDYKGEWLISDFVQLDEELQPSQNSYPQGEPITRTVTLTVANVDKSALPNLAVHWTQTVKVYPDKPQLTSFAQQENYFSQQILSFAIIPNQLGELTLPEISVPWFNSKTQQQEWARLPAKTITIIANKNAQVSNLPAITVADNEIRAQNLSTAPTESPIWRWLTFIFATLWLLTCAVWFIFHKQSQQNPKQEKVVPAKTDNIWPQLQAALKNNDANQSCQLLNLWFKQQWPEIKDSQLNLLPISQECQQACQVLFTFTYGHNTEAATWNGQHLLTLLSKVNRVKGKVTKNQQTNIKSQLNP